MKSIIFFFCLSFLLTSPFNTFAQESEPLAPLDPLYENMVHPIDDSAYSKNLGRNNVEGIIDTQTSVKSQGYRGTCSIFSAIGILESRLKVRYNLKDVDLSEQFLEYLVVRNKTTDGSNSWSNFSAISQYGVPLEKTLPYEMNSWETNTELSNERCGHLETSSTRYKSCLIVQRDPVSLLKTDAELLDQSSPLYDPEFVTARNEAMRIRSQYIRLQNSNFSLYNTSSIKQFLDAGYPLTMGIAIYYGSWNHGAGRSIGVPMNTELWERGIVGYPEKGSLDWDLSRTKPAGHSIVIVGYDDSKEITTTTTMKDGSIKEFTYKGVYYFKNSWGTTSFGKDFEIDGVGFPGYGMITQKYAHEYGSFYHLPL